MSGEIAAEAPLNAQTRYERKLKDRGVRTVSVRLEPGTLDLLTALAKAHGSRQAAITKAIEALAANPRP